MGSEFTAVSVDTNPSGIILDAVNAPDLTGGGQIVLDKPVPTSEFNTFFDAPNRAQPTEQSMQDLALIGKMMLSPDPLAQADVIAQHIPGTEISFDAEFNPIVEINGQRTYVNKPGASGRDFLDFGGAIAKFWPAAKAGSLATTITGKALTTGGLSAVTSVAEDVAAGAAGSKQGIDYQRAGISGLAGAAAEVVIPAAGWALKKLASTNWVQGTSKVFNDLRISLALGGYIGEHGFTASGLALLRQVGVKAEQVSHKLGLSLQRQADEAISPEAALGAAEAESFGVPITRGEAISGSPGEFAQRAEEEVLDQVLADAQSLRPFRTQQQQPALIGVEGDTGLGLLQGEVGQIRETGKVIPINPLADDLGDITSAAGGFARTGADDVAVTAGFPGSTRPALDVAESRTPQGIQADRLEQGGGELSSAVARDARRLEAQRTKAFADPEISKVRFTGDSAHDAVQRMRGTLVNRRDGLFLDQQMTPQAFRIDKFLSKIEEVLKKTKNKKIKPITLRRIENERRRLIKAIDHASTATNKQNFPGDAPLLIGMKKELDAWLNQAVKNALVSGDSAGLEALTKARSLHAEYMTKYGGTKGAAKVMNDLATGNASPMETVNMIFGLNTLGAKKTAIEVVERFETIFGKESAELGKLRELGVLLLAKKATQGGGFSPDRFVTAYDAAFDGIGRDLMRRLYRPEDLKRLAEFRSLAGRLQKPVGMRQSSGSAERAGRMLEGLMKKLLPMMGVASGDPVTAITFGALVKAAEKRASSKALDLGKVRRLPTTRVDQLVLPKAAAAGGASIVRDDE